VLNNFYSSLFSTFQGKNDLQTEADRSAQRCIIASLHKQFPKVSIFGEEVWMCNTNTCTGYSILVIIKTTFGILNWSVCFHFNLQL